MHCSKQNQQQPVIIIQQNANNAQKGVKIKKEDLKFIQQYCEQNDLGMIEMPNVQMMQSLGSSQKTHKKNKSEGATPIASNYMKSHFPSKTHTLTLLVKQQQQQMDYIMMPQQQQLQNPVLDYQKFLEEERLYKQQAPKSKSSLGYYTQSHTPSNNTGKFLPQSKSPEVQYHSQVHQNRQLVQKPYMPMVGSANQSLVSQSAMSNYPIANNVGLQNRPMRSQSRKKSISNQNQLPVYNKTPSLNYNSNNPGSIKNLFIAKNPSQASYKLKSSSIHRAVHEQYSIDGNHLDNLNESSVYLYDDPMLKSNHQHSMMGKTKSQMGYYQNNIHDESYMDASLYEQFIQGPHNISQYSNSKGEVDQSYLQYLTRSVSQNKHQQSLVPQLINPSQSQKTHHTRTNSQQSYSTAQQTKTKRTQAQTVQSSLNGSVQKQIPDRRMLMGRTPSPNFLKRIAGLMQLPPESLILQQHLYQNQHNNTSKNLLPSGHTTKRSSSKQQFSTNGAATSTAKLMGAAATINSQANKSLKQKLAKQYSTNTQVNRYKSGSITTSANTAHNSPQNRGVTPKRNSIKQKTIQTIQQQQQQLYQQQSDFEQMSDALKKQAYLGQVAMNHQNNLRKANLEEEKKALAMISSLDQQLISKHNLSQSSSLVQAQQFYQPMKMIGEIMEEDPQPLSSHEFLNFDEVKVAQQEKNRSKRPQQVSQHNTSKKSFASPASNMYYDGGTGGNKISQAQNQLLLSKNSILSSETQTYSQHPSYIMPQNDHNQITQYLEQLQQKRQSEHFLKQGSAIQSPTSSNKQNKYQSVTDHHIGLKASLDKGNFHVNYQSNQNPIRTKTPSNLIRMIDESERLSPMNNGARRLSDQENISNKHNRKRTTSVEPPQIATPNVEMFKQSMNEYEDRMKEHTNFQKKQQPILFQEKTPFEKELEQKAHEIKQKKQYTSDNSGKAQSYQKDSIQILKQLQESETITEALREGQAQMMKKNVVEYKKPASTVNKSYPKQLQPQILSDKQEVVEVVQKKKGAQLNSKKYLEDEDADQNVENEILITQEEEQQIKEVISDLNERAFYGKILKKSKNVEQGEFQHLSPRSREIATVMKFIKSSFDGSGEPPVTTTDFYRIGKMLGRGAFGKVNLAMHKLVRKLVALKSLNKDCLTDEAQTAKLMKEVQLLLKLRHNHVIKAYETIETEKHIIIVMELCAGGDLLNYVRKRRRLKEPYAKVIFKQIIDGLCYIHSKFIAHRDIKLDNILLDGKGNVKIADFGISKQSQKGQKMTEQCGTPAYIAPEILKDKGYSFNVDIWSAGVVLFAMLYGTVPFKANNMEELHRLIVKGKYTLKDDISIEARNLLRGLLEVNPEKRLTIKQIYRHKWFADLDPDLQLFNDQEREVIRKEYTYNDPRRYNRNENEEPVDCFTEHHIESVYNSLANATSKSIILAPFNSTQSEIDIKDQESMMKLMCEKMMVLKIARRCREIDRMYEQNNNQFLDNGVYHNKVYNSDGESDGENNPDKENNINTDLLSVPMLMSERKSKKRGGRASVENSFEEETSIQQMQDRQQIAKKLKEGSTIGREMRNPPNILKDVDDEMVATYETFQSRYSSNLDEERTKSMVAYGYPHQYVIKSLEESDPNYCTAGYYLLCMDQNYC